MAGTILRELFASSRPVFANRNLGTHPGRGRPVPGSRIARLGLLTRWLRDRSVRHVDRTLHWPAMRMSSSDLARQTPVRVVVAQNLAPLLVTRGRGPKSGSMLAAVRRRSESCPSMNHRVQRAESDQGQFGNSPADRNEQGPRSRVGV